MPIKSPLILLNINSDKKGQLGRSADTDKPINYKI